MFLFALSVIGTLGFLVAYFAVPPGETVASMRLSNLLLGLGLVSSLVAARRVLTIDPIEATTGQGVGS